MLPDEFALRSPPAAFAKRRARLLELRRRDGAEEPVVLSAGWSRPRNFCHNVYPLRAESHFLFLVGEQLEGALLVLDEGEFTLYADEPDPEAALWSGPSPALRDWEERLGILVRPLAELPSLVEVACLPPQDEETAGWLSELLAREVVAQSGPELEGPDARLAQEMVELRLRHDEAGIAQLRSAARLTAQAHRAGMRASRGATREAVVRGAMEGALIAAGLTPGYNSIVTTHGEILHAASSAGALSPGDLILCDVGGETPEGYTADITRTWPVSGEFSPTQREIYVLVLAVQKAAVAGAVSGVNYAALHERAGRAFAEGLAELGILRGSSDELFESGAASLFFPHGLGHLLGLDVHDMEDLGDRAGYGPGASRSSHPALIALRLNRTLLPGMCVTIEPGFYQVPLLLERARADKAVRHLVNWDRLADFSDVRGIRIEDDVLITEREPEVLSRDAPKEMSEVCAVVRSEGNASTSFSYRDL